MLFLLFDVFLSLLLYLPPGPRLLLYSWGKYFDKMYQKLFWSSLRASLTDAPSVTKDVAPLKQPRRLGDWGPHARLHVGRINSAPGQSRQVSPCSDQSERWRQSSPRPRPNERPASIASSHLNFLRERTYMYSSTPGPACCSCTSMRRENGDGTLPRKASKSPSLRGGRLVCRLAARILVSDPSHPLCHLVIAWPSFDAAETGSDQLCYQ
ncbi:hypothetical protein GGI35DRAFT_450216 [Trichoderma velutinum]